MKFLSVPGAAHQAAARSPFYYTNAHFMRSRYFASNTPLSNEAPDGD